MKSVSNPPRIGKIARLPWSVRNALNRRMMDGVEGSRLLEWLNAQVNVREVLRDEFASRPVTKQNLSEWRRGGYQDWLRQQSVCGVIRALAEQAASLDEATGGARLSDRLAGVFSAEMAVIAEKMLDQTRDGDLSERWRTLRELLHETAKLRRGDHHATRLELDRQRQAAKF
jgi:hypothetical protein